MRLHHIGWVVESIETARLHFEDELGLEFDGIEFLPGLKLCFYRIGDSLIELLEATGQGGEAIHAFLESRGEGIHHIAYEVPDVEVSLDKAGKKGMELVDATPKYGVRNTLIGFVNPHRNDGILVEYVQEAPH